MFEKVKPDNLKKESYIQLLTRGNKWFYFKLYIENEVNLKEQVNLILPG